MTEKDRQEQDYTTVLVSHWIDKAQNDLDSAQVNFEVRETAQCFTRHLLCVFPCGFSAFHEGR